MTERFDHISRTASYVACPLVAKKYHRIGLLNLPRELRTAIIQPHFETC
jgi:hypothetical protein